MFISILSGSHLQSRLVGWSSSTSNPSSHYCGWTNHCSLSIHDPNLRLEDRPVEFINYLLRRN